VSLGYSEQNQASKLLYPKSGATLPVSRCSCIVLIRY
jgi:hypothetical protein